MGGRFLAAVVGIAAACSVACAQDDRAIDEKVDRDLDAALRRGVSKDNPRSDHPPEPERPLEPRDVQAGASFTHWVTLPTSFTARSPLPGARRGSRLRFDDDLDTFLEPSGTQAFDAWILLDEVIGARLAAVWSINRADATVQSDFVMDSVQFRDGDEVSAKVETAQADLELFTRPVDETHVRVELSLGARWFQVLEQLRRDDGAVARVRERKVMPCVGFEVDLIAVEGFELYARSRVAAIAWGTSEKSRSGEAALSCSLEAGFRIIVKDTVGVAAGLRAELFDLRRGGPEAPRDEASGFIYGPFASILVRF